MEIMASAHCTILDFTCDSVASRMLKEDYKGKEKDVIISIHHVKSKIVQCADAIISIHHVKYKTVQYTDVIISIHHVKSKTVF